MTLRRRFGAAEAEYGLCRRVRLTRLDDLRLRIFDVPPVGLTISREAGPGLISLTVLAIIDPPTFPRGNVNCECRPLRCGMLRRRCEVDPLHRFAVWAVLRSPLPARENRWPG